MSSGNKEFGKRIKELREAQDYTQEELSELVGLDYQTISRIETGYYFTSFENLKKFAIALKVDLPDLFVINHIKDNTELISLINDVLLKSDSSELQFIYKFISNLKQYKTKK
jgi:transcriptional regulator with XRE-family HTH domain